MPKTKCRRTYGTPCSNAHDTIPCAGVGGARVCRMRDGEECRRLELGWVLDSGDNMALAVNTETGWRKIMVRTVLQLH